MSYTTSGPATPPPPLLHSIDAACAVIGLSRTTLHELMKSGELASVKIRRRTFVPDAAIRDLIARNLRTAV